MIGIGGDEDGAGRFDLDRRQPQRLHRVFQARCVLVVSQEIPVDAVEGDRETATVPACPMFFDPLMAVAHCDFAFSIRKGETEVGSSLFLIAAAGRKRVKSSTKKNCCAFLQPSGD